MRQKNLRKNYFYNLIYEIIVILVPILLTPYLSRTLGANGIGKSSFYESISSYFVLVATMGMTKFGQREVSYCRDSIKKRTKVFWEVKSLSFITVIISLSIYFLVSIFSTNKKIYILYSINIIYVATDITWFFQGLEEFRAIVVRNIFFRLLSVFLIFIFVKDTHDLPIYVLIIVLSSLFGSLLLWFRVPKLLCKISLRTLEPLKNIASILSLFIPTIAIQVYAVLDKTMIGLITKDSFQNGFYEQAMKIPKTLLTVITSLGTALIPRVGYYFEKNEKEKIVNLMNISYRFVWFLGLPMCFGLIMITNRFVPVFFGTGFNEVIHLMKVSAFLIPVIGINTITGNQYLIPTKQQTKYTITVVVGAIVNLCLNFILIRYFYAFGAVVASVAAETVIAIIQLIYVRAQLSILKIIKSSKKYIIATICMLVILYILNCFLSQNIFSLIFMVFIGALVYFAILLLEKDKFTIDNIAIMVQKIKGILKYN